MMWRWWAEGEEEDIAVAAAVCRRESRKSFPPWIPSRRAGTDGGIAAAAAEEIRPEKSDYKILLHTENWHSFAAADTVHILLHSKENCLEIVVVAAAAVVGSSRGHRLRLLLLRNCSYYVHSCRNWAFLIVVIIAGERRQNIWHGMRKKAMMLYFTDLLASFVRNHICKRERKVLVKICRVKVYWGQKKSSSLLLLLFSVFSFNTTF